MLTIARVAAIDARIRAVTAYARKYIDARKKAQASWVQIGSELNITPSWAQQLWDTKQYGQKSAGIDVLLALADKAHGGSVDALFKAAVAGKAPPEQLPPSERPVGKDRPVQARGRPRGPGAKRDRKGGASST